MCVLGQEQIALYLVASQSAPVPHGGRPVDDNSVSVGLSSLMISPVLTSLVQGSIHLPGVP